MLRIKKKWNYFNFNYILKKGEIYVMQEQDISKKILSDIIVHMKYAKYLPDKKRRETWEELVTRNKEMHLRKLPELKDEIEEAYAFVYDKKIVPSMRSLQFSGLPIELNPARQYNCSTVAIDHPLAFSEITFLLLSGCGVGFSVQEHDVAKLPYLQIPIQPQDKRHRRKRYLVGDSIEGWADAVKILMKSYFEGTKDIEFDYRDIRPKGTALVTSGGKAPGPQPLKDCIHNIRKILNLALEERGNHTKLKPIECHDIICFIADAILSGGVRRCLQGDDEGLTNKGMKKIKDIEIGDIMITPSGQQKVVNKFDNGKKKLWKIKTNVGDFYSTDNHRWAKAINLKGEYEWVQTKDLEKSDTLIFNNKRIKGEYQDFPKDESYTSPKLDSNSAWFIGYFLGNGSCSKRKRKDIGHGLIDKKCRVSSPTNCCGIDERVKKEFSKFINKYSIHDKKTSIEFSSSKSDISDYFYKHIKQANIPIIIPSFITENSIEIRLAFLAGLLDSDGSVRMEVTENRIGTGQICLVSTKYYDFARQVQALYSTLGIPTKLKVENREKLGKGIEYIVSTIDSYFRNNLVDKLEKYSLKIQKDYVKYFPKKESYGLVFNRKLAKLGEVASIWNTNKNLSYKNIDNPKFIPVLIQDIIPDVKEEQTYDIEVENEHCFYVNGVLTHNSATISLFSLEDNEMMESKFGNWWEANSQRARANNSVVLLRHKLKKKDFKQLWEKVEVSGSGEPGLILTADKSYLVNPCGEVALKSKQFCNLTSINASSIENQEDFNARCKSASFIGTLQASYTSFHYLRDDWREQTEKEALLGVSMTGLADKRIMESVNFEEGAVVVKKENARMAKKLGINKAYRTCLVKPEGSASLCLGTSSGIHAWFAPYYIRRIRVGKDEAIYQYLSSMHPELVEDEYFKPDLQAVISIPVKAPDSAIYRSESPIDLLERMKVIQENWIQTGHRKGSNFHNVSITVSVKDNEWEEVGDWMWNNRRYYSGISVLPFDGGQYKQAPFEEIDKETYEKLYKKLKNVDLTKVVETDNNVNFKGIVACGGGACEIK